MQEYSSSFGSVELTEERLHHILVFHPDVRAYKRYFGNVLVKPDIIRKSHSDSHVRICYKLYGLKYVAIVVKTNNRNFILTAYITTKIQHKPL